MRCLLPILCCAGLSAASVIDATAYRTVDDPDPALRSAARSMPVVLATPRGGDELYRGLRRLAERDGERYGFRQTRRPSARWLERGGGIALVQRGSSRDPQEHLAESTERIAAIGADAPLRALAMTLAADSISDGARPEYRTIRVERQRALLELHVGSSQLQGMDQHQISSIGPNGIPLNYPIQTPRLNLRQLDTTVLVPAGSGGDASYRVVPSGRHPDLAARAYRGGMRQLADTWPDTVLVYATVPLETDDNQQRHRFNQQIRAAAAADGAALLDLADLLAHEADGSPATDAHGPVVAGSWREGRGLNDAGRERLASAWWQLMDDIAADTQSAEDF
ncbi:MAG: hypothetical protein ACOCXJ_06660 [Planctomycetota bacterium]